MVHIYNVILLSHKKQQNNAICSNMDGPRDIILSEVSQTEKDKYHMISLICGIEKKSASELIYKTKMELLM